MQVAWIGIFYVPSYDDYQIKVNDACIYMYTMKIFLYLIGKYNHKIKKILFDISNLLSYHHTPWFDNFCTTDIFWNLFVLVNLYEIVLVINQSILCIEVI